MNQIEKRVFIFVKNYLYIEKLLKVNNHCRDLKNKQILQVTKFKISFRLAFIAVLYNRF